MKSRALIYGEKVSDTDTIILFAHFLRRDIVPHNINPNYVDLDVQPLEISNDESTISELMVSTDQLSEEAMEISAYYDNDHNDYINENQLKTIEEMLPASNNTPTIQITYLNDTHPHERIFSVISNDLTVKNQKNIPNVLIALQNPQHKRSHKLQQAVKKPGTKTSSQTFKASVPTPVQAHVKPKAPAHQAKVKSQAHAKALPSPEMVSERKEVLIQINISEH
jgi:hypothetical protein